MSCACGERVSCGQRGGGELWMGGQEGELWMGGRVVDKEERVSRGWGGEGELWMGRE